MSPTDLDKWLKKATLDDTGLTRPPAAVLVSTHKDEVRSIDHGYIQSQFRVPVYKEVGRPTHDSIKREQVLTKVTNAFMVQYTIPIDTNQLSKLPSRTDAEVWWMNNEQTINLWSEHGLTSNITTFGIPCWMRCDNLICMVGHWKVHMLVLLPTHNIHLSAKMLPFHRDQRRPIRHESQVYDLFHNLKDEHTLTRSIITTRNCASSAGNSTEQLLSRLLCRPLSGF